MVVSDDFYVFTLLHILLISDGEGVEKVDVNR